MNRTSKLFAAGLGALLFSLGAMAQGPVAHYQKSDNPLSGELRFDKKGQFKIVQFTDVHFCHIPFPEFGIAASNQGAHLVGTRKEVCCCPDHNSGMFSAMKECG